MSNGACLAFELNEQQRRELLDGLVEKGWAVLDDVLPEALIPLLLEEASLQQEWISPGIGRSGDHHVDTRVRTDRIFWMSDAQPAQACFLGFLEGIKQLVNRELYLCLFDFEAQFAQYEPGGYYRKHIDAFRGRGNRVVSLVCYLNEEWREEDGGQLVVYDDDTPLARVQPRAGRVVVFLSEKIPHEVLPAQRRRYSIACWFRVNGSDGTRIDPSR